MSFIVVGHLIAELQEYDREAEVEIDGIGPIDDIEMSDDGKVILRGPNNDIDRRDSSTT